MSELIELNDNTIDDAIAKHPLLVVDCYAEWCSPCRMLMPIIKKLAASDFNNIVFAKLDIESSPITVKTYGLNSVPNLLLFRGGQKVGDIIGALPENKLVDKLNDHMMR